MRIEDKLAILADAAKYDVSCASSGSRRKNTGRRLGNAAPSGICHTYTEDGRCVSLLKILYTKDLFGSVKPVMIGTWPCSRLGMTFCR
jgi:predicted DNA-binding helix-hairpin-helix protein